MPRKLFGRRSGDTADPSVADTRERLNGAGALPIDVREPDEWAAGHVAEARHIPLGELPARLAELPRDRERLLICRSGNRSGAATRLLQREGFTLARNVQGGMNAWGRQGYPIARGK